MINFGEIVLLNLPKPLFAKEGDKVMNLSGY